MGIAVDANVPNNIRRPSIWTLPTRSATPFAPRLAKTGHLSYFLSPPLITAGFRP